MTTKQQSDSTKPTSTTILNEKTSNEKKDSISNAECNRKNIGLNKGGSPGKSTFSISDRSAFKKLKNVSPSKATNESKTINISCANFETYKNNTKREKSHTKSKYKRQFSIKFHPFSFRLTNPFGNHLKTLDNISSKALIDTSTKTMNQRCCLSVSVVQPSDKHGSKSKKKNNNVSMSNVI